MLFARRARRTPRAKNTLAHAQAHGQPEASVYYFPEKKMTQRGKWGESDDEVERVRMPRATDDERLRDLMDKLDDALEAREEAAMQMEKRLLSRTAGVQVTVGLLLILWQWFALDGAKDILDGTDVITFVIAIFLCVSALFESSIFMRRPLTSRAGASGFGEMLNNREDEKVFPCHESDINQLESSIKVVNSFKSDDDSQETASSSGSSSSGFDEESIDSFTCGGKNSDSQPRSSERLSVKTPSAATPTYSVANAKEASAVAQLRQRLEDIADRCKPGMYYGLQLDSSTLVRFLRARKLDLEAAEAMFRAALEWREKVNPAQVYASCEAEMPAVFKYRTGGWLPTLDKGGSPVFIDCLGRLDVGGITARVDVKGITKFAIWRQETNQRLLAKASEKTGKPQNAVLVIQDLKGLGWQHAKTAGFALVKACGQVDDRYYPESLKLCIIVNAPRVFSFIWGVCKHFFDPSTRDKVQIYSSAPMKVLEEHVDKKNLPTFLGGRFDASKHVVFGGLVPADCPSIKEKL